MATRELAFTVEKTRDGSSVPVGATWDTVAETVTVGRDPGVDLRLNDTTVSREHVRLISQPDAVVVENLSARSASFVNGHKLEAGERRRIDAASFHLQLGRVLVRVDAGAATTSFDEAISIVDRPELLELAGGHAWADAGAGDTLPLIAARWDAGQAHIRVLGRELEIFPTAAILLATLCETPGEPVHHSDLQHAVGSSANLDQQVSYVRKAFRDLVDAGVLSAARIRRCVLRHTAGVTEVELHALDSAELMRRFVSSKRGFGFRICLSPEDVRIDAGVD